MTNAERQQRRARFLAAATYPAKLYQLLVAILDPSGPRNVSVLGGRQSAKSHTCTAAALALALATPNVNVVYVTSTYATVARMAFGPAKRMKADFSLGGDANSAAQSITFKNGSTVYFLGADSDKTVQRLKGIPNLVAVFLDEAGVWASELLAQIIETVRPGLRPRAGKLVVLGNPSLAGPIGTWFDITRNTEYAQYRLTYRDNDKVPSFADTERLIDEDLRAQGVTRDSAYYLREYGDESGVQFVTDLTERVYQLTEINLVDELPKTTFDNYVTGGDIGITANDALVTLGWDNDSTDVYVVEELAARGQDSLTFASMVKDVTDHFHPITIAVDAGGLGGKTIRTVQSLFQDVPIAEAVKPAIVLQVRAVNQLLRSGRLKLRRNSQLARDLSTPTWDTSADGTKSINEHGKHSDLAPALRYGVIAATPLLPDVPEDETEEQRRQRLDVQAKADRLAAARKQARLRKGKPNDDDMAEMHANDEEPGSFDDSDMWG